MNYYNNNRNLIECAVIKVEISKDGGDTTLVLNYNTRTKDIEKTMNFLKFACEEIGYPAKRIYLSGFALLTEDYIWTNEKIYISLKNQIIGAHQNDEGEKISIKK